MLLGYLAAGIAIFHGVFRVSFLSDDFVFLNAVQGGDPFGIWSRRGQPFFRPLASISWFIDYSLCRMNPVGYHVTILLLHVSNAFLVYLVCGRLLAIQSGFPLPAKWLAAGTGLLFLSLSNHSEPIVWLSCRADLWCTFFGLIPFLTYLMYERSPRRSYLALSVTLFAAALLSKEAMLGLPLITLARARSERIEGARWRWVKISAPYLFVVILYVLVRFEVLGLLTGGYGAMHLNLGRVPHFLRRAVWRSFLPPIAAELRSVVYVLLVVALAALVLLAIRRRRRHSGVDANPAARLVGFSMASLFIALGPVMTLVPTSGATDSRRPLACRPGINDQGPFESSRSTS